MIASTAYSKLMRQVISDNKIISANYTEPDQVGVCY